MESYPDYTSFGTYVRSCARELWDALLELHEAYIFQKSKNWHNRKFLKRPYYEDRQSLGFFATNFQHLKKDEVLFFKYTRMDLETFNYLLHLKTPHFNILRRRADGILEEERLAVTLRYLASGDDISSLSVSYRIAESTCREVIKDTCQVIVKALSGVYLRPPNKFKWKNIAKGFEFSWNLPNCIGCIDGKHISIKAPHNTGSVYYNYKKFFSIILLAACNHKYEFTLFDVGAFGSESDGGVFNRSEIGKSFNDGSLDIPDETPNLPNSSVKTPYFFVGDEAFRMTTNMMRPYPGRHLSEEKKIFNYRLSRGRRCIENAFGILTARWGILNRRISFQPKNVKSIVVACLCLHNFLMSKTQRAAREHYCPPGFTDRIGSNGELIPGQWRNEVAGDSDLLSNSAGEAVGEATAMREALTNYFVSPEGAVSWQRDYVNLGKHREDLNEQEIVE